MFDWEDGQTIDAEDLLTGRVNTWQGRHRFLRLDPRIEPAHVFRLKRR